MTIVSCADGDETRVLAIEDDRQENGEYQRLLSGVVAASEIAAEGHRRLDSAAWLERFEKLQSISPANEQRDYRDTLAQRLKKSE